MGFSIAIDGPAAAGKSTLAKRLAEDLGFVYIDTGAMYRAMAFYLLKKGIEVTDIEDVEACCEEINIILGTVGGKTVVYVNGIDVSSKIRSERIGKMASDVGTIPAVRKKLVKLQQQMAEYSDVVMDGRDIGTCVLPNAQLKIYLTADTDIRAGRRYLEQIERGISSDLDSVKKEMRERDLQDMTRTISPLKKAEDAIEIDTSYMDADEVVKTVKNCLYGCKAEERQE